MRNKKMLCRGGILASLAAIGLLAGCSAKNTPGQNPDELPSGSTAPNASNAPSPNVAPPQNAQPNSGAAPSTGAAPNTGAAPDNGTAAPNAGRTEPAPGGANEPPPEAPNRTQ